MESGEEIVTYRPDGTEQQGEGNGCRLTGEGGSGKCDEKLWGSVTDKIMRGPVELGLQVYDIERDAEKVDRVASPS